MKTALLLLVAALAACGAKPAPATTPAPTASASAAPLQIKLATIYVDDQDKALHFYTDVLGFSKKDDVTNGPYRWLTVSAPGTDGAALQLASSGDPAAKAYQQALFDKSMPAAMFFTDDVKREYERIKAKGATFTMPPTPVTGSTIAVLQDTCGNLIQITQLDH